jgi:hypothetical protein
MHPAAERMRAPSMLGDIVLFDDDFAYITFFAAIASASIAAPHWQPNSSS